VGHSGSKGINETKRILILVLNTLFNGENTYREFPIMSLILKHIGKNKLKGLNLCRWIINSYLSFCTRLNNEVHRKSPYKSVASPDNVSEKLLSFPFSACLLRIQTW